MKTLTTLIVSAILLFSGSTPQEVAYQGEWDNYSRWTTFEGSWKIEKTEEGYQVVMGADFEAKKAPDLKIFVSKVPLDDITSKNALKVGDPAFIAKLTSYEGKASYAIPASINLADYQTIMVHCESYSKFWGGSALK